MASGAADGYARMTGKPACTLLHLGPGLTNALANLHNACRARVPLINIVGDHARFHRHYETPLAMHDPGEAPLAGSVLWARHGQGTFVYTGLAFFRQLPAGVPGAFRLFANLLAGQKTAHGR